MSSAGRTAGRPPGPSSARDDILASARRMFAERGYPQTTLRAVAHDAGVQPSLVHYYFGSKEGLFRASVDFPVDPVTVLPVVLAGPREEVGRRLATVMVSAWSTPASRDRLVALIRASTDQPEAASALKEFVETLLLARVAQATGATPKDLAAAAGQAVGLLIMRHVVGLGQLTELTDDEVVTLIAPIIQAAVPN